MPNQIETYPAGFELRHVLPGDENVITRIAWSPDGQTLAVPSGGETIKLWDLELGKEKQSLTGYPGIVYCVAWSPDGSTVAAGCEDGIIRLWNADTEAITSELVGHRDQVRALVWLDGKRLISGGFDRQVLLWDVQANQIQQPFKGHTSRVRSLAICPSKPHLFASASSDATVRLWDTKTGQQYQVLKGHSDTVRGVAWLPDSPTPVSASNDKTILVWNAETGNPRKVLEGHLDLITCISVSYDGQLLASKSVDNTVLLWRCDTWQRISLLREPVSIYFSSGLAFHPHAAILATLGEKDTVVRIWDLDFATLLGAAPVAPSVNYINAKVVLVGESSVGKSGLGIRMAEKEFRLTESTHGAQFWQIPVPEDVAHTAHVPDDVQAELTLWDLAGQAEYHLIHQLFLDDTDVALLLFDCSNPNEPFEGVPYWAKVLKKHLPSRARKFLISARCDVSPVTVERREINDVLADYELDNYLKTSAKTGEGVDELMDLILTNIPWDQLHSTSTLVLFQTIREYLMECKSADRPLVPMHEVLREIRKRYTKHQPELGEVKALVGLLQTRGLVYRLDPTPNVALVLLRPELINQYASSIIQAARNHPRGIGAIPERDVVTANLPLVGFERLEPVDEKTVLESTVELLIKHDLCFREMGELVFPSQVNVMRPQPAETQPRAEVTYEFSGVIESIYASLVVRLSHTDYFRRQEQWKYAAEFSRNGSRLGFSMRQIEEGTGELGIYFHFGVGEFDRVTFIRFITDHLHTKGIDIHERIRLYCPNCSEEVTNLRAIETRMQAGELDILCQYCNTPVIIPGSIEELYKKTPAIYEKRQQELKEQAEKRTQQEVTDFKENQQQYTSDEDDMLHILHLSDVHLGTPEEAHKYRMQLESDLKLELGVNRLEYLVISGDIASHSTEEEYEAAFELVNGLVSRFGLDARRVVVVPGNHDLNWDLSRKAYPFVHKTDLPDSLPEGRCIEAGDVGALVRDDDLYRLRFANFSEHFYRRVCGEPYPLDYAEQAIIRLRPDDRLLFLALNSAWEIDHHHRDRAGINMEALAEALDQLLESEYRHWVKIAVWHHPVTGREMMNDEFLQLLVQHKFQVCMHGHVHEAQEGFYKYDDQRGLAIIGAGTFGAPASGQVPGIPLQYNLLTLDPRTRPMDPKTRLLTVKTRRKDKPDGAWMADARWGDKNEPKPWYTIQLPLPKVQPVDKVIPETLVGELPLVGRVTAEKVVVAEQIDTVILQPVSFTDLEIRILPRREGGYPVEITLDDQQVFRPGYMAEDILPWTPSGDLVADGQRLFDTLFSDVALRMAWDQAQGQSPQRRIRLRIDAGAAELHTLPWELLREDNVMLAASASTPFSRYLPVSEPWGRIIIERPIRVLVAISNPGDLADFNLAPLDVLQERSVLEMGFEGMNPDEIQFDFLEAPVTLERLEVALFEGFHVLHYIGHGAFSERRQQATLFLEDEEGRTRIVRDDALIEMLARGRVQPLLVFLAACQSAIRSTGDAYSGLAPKLVAAGVPAVVAMQDIIAAMPMRRLSGTFYRRVIAHGVVDRAMNAARSVLLTGSPDAALPMLFTRLKDGRLFDHARS